MGRVKKYDRKEIIKLVQTLFWDRGISMVGMGEIEEVTGVNKSGLYREFSGKDEIILETIKSYLEDASSFYEQLEAEPLGLDNIKSFLGATRVKGKRRGCYFVKLISEKKALSNSAIKLLKGHFNKLEDLIGKNLTSVGYNKDVAKLVINFDIGICNKAYLGISEAELESEIETLLDCLKS
jgi:AcrR family transcriptional regulator